MKKIIKLTESDLQRIVNRVIRESMISELGGMDDGHPFSGNMNFNDLSSDDRKKVNKYYRVDDEEVDDSFSELDSELEDDFEDEGEGFPEWDKLKKYMDDRDEKMNKNRERPFNSEEGFPEWEKLKKNMSDRDEKMNKNRERPFNRD